MTSSALALVIAFSASTQLLPGQRLVSPSPGGPIQQQELEEQKTAYKQLWETDLVTRFDDLPKEGKVPDYRIPYSGHDYPDKTGGTLASMAKYDRAFNRGQSKAYQHEREDLDFHTTVRTPGQEIVRRGLFGRVIGVTNAPAIVPTWYGHCNGWTAASIRHAEPQKSVVRGGVTFTPADIKGMLAELYMYSQTQSLGGIDDAVNPGTLHLTLANWLGRKSHPVAMETALGDPVINFPIYGYKSTIAKLAANRYDVRTLITYALHTPREFDKSPKSNRQLFFHYTLDLDANGNIAGGLYQRDSGQVDMLWTPLKPVQGGKDGNRGGNPYLDVKEVLALWQDSVDPETLKKWVNIDPTDEERVLVRNDLPSAPKQEDGEKRVTAKPESAPAETDTLPAPAATTEPAAAANTSPAPAVAVPPEPAPPATVPPAAPPVPME